MTTVIIFKMTVLFFFIMIFLVSPNDSARILAVFPNPSISHQVAFRPLTQELAKRGHDVVIITPDPAFPKGRAPPNLKEIDVHDISYKIWGNTFLKTSKGNKNDLRTQFETILGAAAVIVDAILKDPQVEQMIHDENQKFDLILLEACIRPALIFSHIYKVPVILVSSFGATFDNNPVIGVPVHPFLYPTYSNQKFNNLTLWEKAVELYNNVMLDITFENFKAIEHGVLKSHVDDLPSMDELNNNVHMLFLNINQVFAGIRPVPPNVIFMGGIHQIPDKELPNDLNSYLDSSKEGVIYISFGTNVNPSQLPSEKIQTLVQAFSEVPYDVLWKWDKDELPGRTSNIKIAKWLPQSDLLKHPKIKLFITQGGLQSTDEAITAGVPLIGMPMLGDQWFNVERYEYLKIGKRLDMETLTKEKLIKSIKTIIEDDSYRRNIVKLREIMRDEPMSPLDRAVWWTEYVLRHGGAKHLRSPAANISWSQYLELDLVFAALAVLLTAVAILIIILRFIYNSAIRNYESEKIKRT